jgi:hypothetical protein
MFTKDQITEYLKHGGNGCPYCKSRNITADQIEIPDGTTTFQTVYCEACGKSWNDIYELTGIEEVEAEEAK